MEKNLNTKLTETAELFRTLKETCYALTAAWNNPDIAAVISKADDSYPFETSFDDVLFGLCDWTADNVRNFEQAEKELHIDVKNGAGYYLIYPKGNMYMSLCEIKADSPAEAIAFFLENYNYDSTYNVDNVIAVLNSKTSLMTGLI